MDDDWREVVAEWQEQSVFVGRNGNGGVVQIGSSEGKPGIGPMEMLLFGIAGCTGVDIVNILTKKRKKLLELQIKVRGKRAEAHPKVFTDIEIVYLLVGQNLEPKAVEQAIQLSEEKYCSASAMLRASAKITSSYQIIAAEPSPQ